MKLSKLFNVFACHPHQSLGHGKLNNYDDLILETPTDNDDHFHLGVYESERLSEDYDIGCNTTVQGTFGHCFFIQDVCSGQQCVAKCLSKNNSLKTQLARKEICILSLISDHPGAHLPELLAVYEDRKSSVLVFPKYGDIDLFEYLVENGGRLCEDIARSIIHQLLSALLALHDLGIAHCDVKLSNIMVEVLSEKQVDVTLIDLGSAQDCRRENSTQLVGSHGFTAPEVLERNFDQKCDIFSLGVVLFILLFGYNPFDPFADSSARGQRDTRDRVLAGFENIEKKGYGPHFPMNSRVSDECRDFLVRVLETCPSNRLTALEALMHPWITRQ